MSICYLLINQPADPPLPAESHKKKDNEFVQKMLMGILV